MPGTGRLGTGITWPRRRGRHRPRGAAGPGRPKAVGLRPAETPRSGPAGPHWGGEQPDRTPVDRTRAARRGRHGPHRVNPSPVRPLTSDARRPARRSRPAPGASERGIM
ncbi:hypothetical protein B9W64_13710 [Streptomyces sp. CS159]|nr:hypothetical protein B9W64_13710 [Streptomyces sp. CS159]